MRDATIDAGTLQSTGSGKFIVGAGQSELFGLAQLTSNATISVHGSASLLMRGNITNTGEIDLSKSGSASLVIDDIVELQGDGSINLRRGDSIVSANKATFVIGNNTISGAGLIGDARMSLATAGGVIDASGRGTLTIDTGAHLIGNLFGTIEATGGGRGLILSRISNGGTLVADGGTLIFRELVGGTPQSAGSAVINDGTLDFRSKFDENVAFTGSSGVLKLADSRHYAASVSGFSSSGGTSFDLKDIRFIGAGEATFNGSAASGVLTVTDGKHTANITLIGDYTHSTFVVTAGHRGVVVVASGGTEAAAASPNRFIAAMAGLAGSPGGAIPASHAAPIHESMLFKPRAMFA